MGAQPGSLEARLEERYFCQRVLLGQGGFGTVWRAVDKETGRTVAIKQLDKFKPSFVPELIDGEIRLMSACKHENIVQLLNTFEDDNAVYIALEYCDGGDFFDKLRERGPNMEEFEAAEWVRQMVEAVAYLHRRRILHRDIKPENFMVHRRHLLRLSDFGLACTYRAGELLHQMCGTLAYNSPEKHEEFRGHGYGTPSDVWAVGVSMYQVLMAGKHPFTKRTEQGVMLNYDHMFHGILDFREDSNPFPKVVCEGFGMGMRFSDEARTLCKSMVTPDPRLRVELSEVAKQGWIYIGQGTVRQLGAPSGQAVGKQHDGRNRRASSSVRHVPARLQPHGNHPGAHVPTPQRRH